MNTELRDEVLRQRTEKLLGKKYVRMTTSMLSQLSRPNEFLDLSRLNLSTQRDEILNITELIESANEPSRSHNEPRTNGTTKHLSNGYSSTNTAGSYNLSTAQTALATLSEGPCPFLMYDHIRDRWSLSPPLIASHLRELEILRLISKRIDSAPALRIIRMLISLGKLDEKMLQEVGLLNAKELRQTLAHLESIGLIELQEVPREPQRQPNRTMFLWFWDAERVANVLLSEIYKCMARLYQLLGRERARIKGTLDKVERSDVRGREEEFLGTGELEVLRRWRRMETWLVAEIERLDDSVILLKDL